ncbi:MAG TPA: UDP-3-O-(3-hydroxymyristoyl)glucosamine N-acyltransferase [Rhizomicrobium sp.]
MTDVRFFRRGGPFTLGDLAARVGAELPSQAPAAFMVNDIAALDRAQSGEISVFSDAQHSAAFETTHASVVLTNRKLSAHEHNGSWLLLVNNPRLAFTQIGYLFYPPDALLAGTHKSAQVDPTATIGADAQIDAGAVIGAGVEIGLRSHICSNAVIGDGVVIGNDCIVGANAAISHTLIGSKVHIGSNASIGNAGFGFVFGPDGMTRMSQLGRVVIADNVEIGANCTIDRGTMSDTRIGTGSVLDNAVHIAHNVVVGQGCVLAAQTGIAGSTTLGDFVATGGQVGISDHLSVGSYARIAAKSGVIRDIKPKETVGGYPALPARQWHRQTLALLRLIGRKAN